MAYHYPRQYRQPQRQFDNEGISYNEPQPHPQPHPQQQQQEVNGTYAHGQFNASPGNYESQSQGWINQNQNFPPSNGPFRSHAPLREINGPYGGIGQQVNGRRDHGGRQASGPGNRGILLDRDVANSSYLQIDSS